MKFKFGSFVTDGKGKIGGQVVSKNSRGNYLKTKVSASNPQTNRQLQVRANFSTIVHAWSLLSEDSRRKWILASGNYPQKDRIGTTFYLSGFGLFTKVNMVRLNLSESILVFPGPNPVFPSWKIVAIRSFSLSSCIWLFFNPTIPVGYRLQIYATDLVSVGLNRAHGIYKLIGYVSPAQTYPFNIYSLWNSVFNKQLQSGTRIIFKLALVHEASGFISQFGVFNSDVTAGFSPTSFTNYSASGRLFLTTTIWWIFQTVSSRVFLCTGNTGKLLYSDDNCVSFFDTGISALSTNVYSLVEVGPGHLLCVFGTAGYMAESFDNGVSWVSRGLVFSSGGCISIVKSNTGSIIVASANSRQFAVSIDNGVSFSIVNGPVSVASYTCLCVVNDCFVLATSTSTPNIFQSFDGGLNWSVLYSLPGTLRFNFVISCGDGVLLLFTGLTSHIYRSSNYGADWVLVFSLPTSANFWSGYYVGNGVVVAAGFNPANLLISRDFGLTWVSAGNPQSQVSLRSFALLSNGRLSIGTGNLGNVLLSTN